MKRLRGIVGCVALGALVLGCGPAPKQSTAAVKEWAAPTQRHEGCCKTRALPTAAAAATMQPDYARLREHTERDIQRVKEQAAEAGRQFAEARRRAARALREAEAAAWEATRAETMGLDLEARKKQLGQLLEGAQGNPDRHRRVMELVEMHNREVRRKVAEGQRKLDAMVDDLQRMLREGAEEERGGMRLDEM